MRFLLLLALLAGVLWFWRSGRAGASRGDPATPPAAQTMIVCAWCQVHVPQSEVLAGKHGKYCCAQHRQQAES